MQVLPPANGKKLWRVRRSVSTGGNGSQEANSTRECLNNSLKISAAGMDFMSRRPPSRRPKSKSGERKDFVFVDLSPVKTESDEDSLPSDTSDVTSASLGSPFQDNRSIFSLNSNTLSPTSSIEEEFLKESLASYDVSAAMLGHDTTFDFGFLEDENHYQCSNSTGSIHSQTLYECTDSYDYYQPPQCHSCHMKHIQEMYTMRQPGQAPCCHGHGHSATSQDMPFKPSQFIHRRAHSTTVVPTRKVSAGYQSNMAHGSCSIRKPPVRKMRRTLSQPAENIISSLLCESSSAQSQTYTPPTPSVSSTFVANSSGELDYFSDFPITDLDFATEITSVQPSPVTEFSNSDSKELYGSSETDGFEFEDFCALNNDPMNFSSLLAL